MVRLGLLNEMRRSVCTCAERIENEWVELDIGSGGRERERLGGVCLDVLRTHRYFSAVSNQLPVHDTAVTDHSDSCWCCQRHNSMSKSNKDILLTYTF